MSLPKSLSQEHAQREVTSNGGQQSSAQYDFTLINPHALFAIAEVLKKGADKYGVDNPRYIASNSHLNHALAHIYAYLANDKQDNHLVNACCRLLFALTNDIKGELKRDNPG